MAAPHRAMFSAGGSWAIVAVCAVAWDTGLDLTRSPLGGLAEWHGHEMVFGFAAAMFAGYALTAMTAWSSTARLSGAGVGVLVVLWALARLSAAGSFGPDPRLAAPAAAAFMAFVTLSLARAALCSASPKGAALAVFSLAMTGLQVAVVTGAIPPRISVLGLAVLLSVMGGRMVAAFTLNRLAGGEQALRRFRIATVFGGLGGLSILAALVLETRAAASDWLVACLLVAAACEAARTALWLSGEILRDGLLLMLHGGFAWLPTGLLLLALGKASGSALPESAALHGLAAGAVACAIYAVAARAIARRADRLRPSFVDGAGFILLWTAAALRVFAPPDTLWHAVVPVVWVLAWAAFLTRHGSALLRPAPRPVFSGPKRHIPGRPRGADHPDAADPDLHHQPDRAACFDPAGKPVASAGKTA